MEEEEDTALPPSLPPSPSTARRNRKTENDDDSLAFTDEDLEDEEEEVIKISERVERSEVTEEKTRRILEQAERLRRQRSGAHAASRREPESHLDEEETAYRERHAQQFPGEPYPFKHIRMGNTVDVQDVINEVGKQFRKGPATIVGITFTQQTVYVKFDDYKHPLTATFANVKPLADSSTGRRAYLDAWRRMQQSKERDREQNERIKEYSKSSSSMTTTTTTAKRPQPSSSSSSSTTTTAMKKAKPSEAIPKKPNVVRITNFEGEEEEGGLDAALAALQASSQGSDVSFSSTTSTEMLIALGIVPASTGKAVTATAALASLEPKRPRGRPPKHAHRQTKSVGSIDSTEMATFLREVTDDLNDSPVTSSSTTTTTTTTTAAFTTITETPPPPPPPEPQRKRKKRDTTSSTSPASTAESRELQRIARSNDLTYKTVMNSNHTVRQRVAAMCAMQDISLGPKSVKGWEAQYFSAFPSETAELEALMDGLSLGNAESVEKLETINEDFWEEFAETYGFDIETIPDNFISPRDRFDMTKSIRLDVNAEFDNSQFEMLSEAGYSPFVEVQREEARAMTYADLIDVVKKTYRIPGVDVVLTELVFERKAQAETAKFRRSSKRAIVERTNESKEEIKSPALYRFHWQPAAVAVAEEEEE